MTPPLADYRWLLSTKAETWLRRTADDSRSDVALATALRRDLSAERTHLVLQQCDLRRRANAKFPLADQMFFTPIALEQATDYLVAAYKAARWQSGEPVLDLCCGIGGDLAALATRGPSFGADRHPVHALFARHNASLYASANSAVLIADVEKPAWPTDIPWHIDPDRRSDGRRTTRVELQSPDVDQLDAMLIQTSAAAIKLAPAATVPNRWAPDAELEWISRQGQCRQLVAWFGRLAGEPGRRRATILRSPSLDKKPEVHTLVGTARRPPMTTVVGRFIFEPDTAVLAAELSGLLADRHNLLALTPGGGYLTSDLSINDPMMAPFEVLDVLSFDRRRLKQALAAQNIGPLEIKTRGVTLDPNQLRRELRTSGDTSGVLLLMRLGTTVTAVLARRPNR